MLKNKKVVGVFFSFFLSVSSLLAQSEGVGNNKTIQNPPVNMEAMAGSRGIFYQMIIAKKFQSIPKLGFFGLTSVNAAWEKEITPDIMSQAHLTYSLFKGLDVTAGFQYSPVYSFRPVASLMYSYASPDFMVVVNPKVDLADDAATETMVLLEYKPKINEKLRFYSRVQGMYGFVPESGTHNRSYILLRAGLSYKEFSFGAGSNFDWYGPFKHNENSIGVFVNTLIF